MRSDDTFELDVDDAFSLVSMVLTLFVRKNNNFIR